MKNIFDIVGLVIQILILIICITITTHIHYNNYTLFYYYPLLNIPFIWFYIWAICFILKYVYEIIDKLQRFQTYKFEKRKIK